MVLKIKEKYEKSRHVKNINKPRKYILCGERKTRYRGKIISRNKKS